MLNNNFNLDNVDMDLIYDETYINKEDDLTAEEIDILTKAIDEENKLGGGITHSYPRYETLDCFERYLRITEKRLDNPELAKSADKYTEGYYIIDKKVLRQLILFWNDYFNKGVDYAKEIQKYNSDYQDALYQQERIKIRTALVEKIKQSASKRQ